MRYRFKDEPDIPAALALCVHFGMAFNMLESSFFIARQTVISTPGGGMAPWREHLFVAMSRNARDAADYYNIPTNRVIELGTQVEIRSDRKLYCLRCDFGIRSKSLVIRMMLVRLSNTN